MYRATGRVTQHRPELFTDLDWFWIFEGLGVTPRDYDPLVDTVDFEQVKRLMLAISQKVSADAAAAPTSRQLLRPGKREARRRAQGRRRGAIGRLTCLLQPNYWPASNWVAPSACAFSAPGPEDVRAVERLPTGEREETLRQIEAVLDRWRSQHGAPRALGIASFGPVDLRANSPTHGFITSTTKPGWRNTDVAQQARSPHRRAGGLRHRRQWRGTR